MPNPIAFIGAGIVWSVLLEPLARVAGAPALEIRRPSNGVASG